MTEPHAPPSAGTDDPAGAAATAFDLSDQPHAIVVRDGVRYTLLGTAHVSRASVDAVRAAIASGDYDTIAVELDEQRLQAMTDPAALGRLTWSRCYRGQTPLFAATSRWPLPAAPCRAAGRRARRRTEGGRAVPHRRLRWS